jgi:hypothetical protein
MRRRQRTRVERFDGSARAAIHFSGGAVVEEVGQVGGNDDRCLGPAPKGVQQRCHRLLRRGADGYRHHHFHLGEYGLHERHVHLDRVFRGEGAI